MNYRAPALHYCGTISQLLGNLISPSNAGCDARVTKLVRAIDEDNDARSLNVSALCQKLKLNVTGPYAARLFKNEVGIGIREYARKKRLFIAAAKLRTTDLPIKTIAADLGYNKPFDFARSFRRQFHLSPREYRKREN